MSSVVVVKDESTVVKTCDVDRIRYCGSGVIGVFKTQHAVIFIGCVRNVDGKPKKEWTIDVISIWNDKC